MSYQIYPEQGPATTRSITDQSETASDLILSRLSGVRSLLRETSSNLSAAADKIVGAVPTPIQGNNPLSPKSEGLPPCCFLDALQQVISEIELAGSDLYEHVNRLHRHF